MVNQSTTHDRLVDLLRANPWLICEIWTRATGRELPPGVARIRDTNLRVRSFGNNERHLQVDVLLTIHASNDPDAPDLFALVVEVQLRPDSEKLFTWVEYLAAARRQYRCPAEVVVLSHRPRVLRWAEQLFGKEPSLCPVLIGRDQIPVLDDEAAARRRPAHAILAAVFHADSDRVAELAELAVIGLHSLPAWRRSTYIALLQETLPEDIVDEVLERLAKEAVEEAEREMKRARPWRSGHRQGLAEGIEQGRLETLREALWLIVELRGLAVDERGRARVEDCHDSDQLHRWLVRLKTVECFADALED